MRPLWVRALSPTTPLERASLPPDAQSLLAGGRESHLLAPCLPVLGSLKEKPQLQRSPADSRDSASLTYSQMHCLLGSFQEECFHGTISLKDIRRRHLSHKECSETPWCTSRNPEKSQSTLPPQDILALPLASCIDADKALDFSQFPLLPNGCNNRLYQISCCEDSINSHM